MELTFKFVMREVSKCSASPLRSTWRGSGFRRAVACGHRTIETVRQQTPRNVRGSLSRPQGIRTAHRVGAMHAREILATRCVVACVGANESTSPVMIIMQRLSLCRLGGSVVKFSQGAYQSPRRPFLRHRPFSYRAPWRSSRSTSRRLRSLSRACRAASSAS